MIKKAFTLTEILISLSIIGVIAVLTIPNISNNIYGKADVATLQSTLKTLNEAIKTAMVNQHVLDVRDLDLFDEDIAQEEGTEPQYKFYNKYLKVTKFCDDFKDCFADEYSTISGESTLELEDLIPDKIKTVILPSGASLLFVEDTETSIVKSVDMDSNLLSMFIIDLNASKKPNMVGKDLFAIGLDSKGNVGFLSEITDDEYTNCVNGTDYGYSCLYLIEDAGWKADIVLNNYSE